MLGKPGPWTMGSTVRHLDEISRLIRPASTGFVDGRPGK